VSYLANWGHGTSIVARAKGSSARSTDESSEATSLVPASYNLTGASAAISRVSIARRSSITRASFCSSATEGTTASARDPGAGA